VEDRVGRACHDGDAEQANGDLETRWRALLSGRVSGNGHVSSFTLHRARLLTATPGGSHCSFECRYLHRYNEDVALEPPRSKPCPSLGVETASRRTVPHEHAVVQYVSMHAKSAPLAARARDDHDGGQMKSVAVSEFKSHCLSLLEDVARTGEPILVTKRGKPLARITPSGDIAVARPQDTLRGSVSYHGDLLAPVVPAEAWNAVRGVLLPEAEAPARRKRARSGAGA
jgi:prevent-host-death family protein